MKLRIQTLTALALLLVAAVAGTASANQTAPKPGFLPGTWIGKGTIKGSVEDGPMWTTFSGGITSSLMASCVPSMFCFQVPLSPNSAISSDNAKPCDSYSRTKCDFSASKRASPVAFLTASLRPAPTWSRA